MKRVLYLCIFALLLTTSCQKETLKETGYWANENLCVELTSSGTANFYKVFSSGGSSFLGGTQYDLYDGDKVNLFNCIETLKYYSGKRIAFYGIEFKDENRGVMEVTIYGVDWSYKAKETLYKTSILP